MKILALCSFGQNRSRFLAEHLRKNGYDADFAGVDADHGLTQEKIDSADVLVTVHKTVRERLGECYRFGGKRVIELDVEDSPQIVLPPGDPVTGEDWIRFQGQHVYPKLVEQIEKYFPSLKRSEK